MESHSPKKSAGSGEKDYGDMPVEWSCGFPTCRLGSVPQQRPVVIRSDNHAELWDWKLRHINNHLRFGDELERLKESRSWMGYYLEMGWCTYQDFNRLGGLSK